MEKALAFISSIVDPENNIKFLKPVTHIVKKLVRMYFS
jgi:hypothetical protein